VDELQRLPIFIDDTPYVRISHIRNVARMNRRQNKCDLIVIDYLQLANAGSSDKLNREQQVAEMSRQLKALAKELQVPIILLSQLSRDVEKRGGMKKPNMSDLRESGAIEQDADLIIFPWRPTYYGIEPEVDDPKHYGELILAKNRHGKTGEIKFWHNDDMTDFSDLPFGSERYCPHPDSYTESISANLGFEKEGMPF
jgi:replicative DNA helicase